MTVNHIKCDPVADQDLQDVVIGGARVSTDDVRRPGLSCALSALPDGDADGLVVARFDRLAPSLSNAQDAVPVDEDDQDGTALGFYVDAEAGLGSRVRGPALIHGTTPAITPRPSRRSLMPRATPAATSLSSRA